ncbi:mucin-5AC-like, partial [Aricia agestis]|uniref:mucin-5AC-like n=1 Tax=Aricia agestis TaxID=91739 RepID=UPI001C20AA10
PFCLQVTRDRRPFLRRTKPTRAPETSTEPIETTTRNLTRGPNRFRNRVQSTTARTDRPTRTYLRRRTGSSATTAVNTTSSATTSSTSASLTSRRTLFVNRRRPGVTTLSPTTTEPLPNEPTVKTTTLSPTAFIESEEVLQEIGEIDYLEDSTQVTTDLPRTTEYVQRRRPLVQLQIKTEDQNQAATTEEEKKRQSKKYSSSFKQNELNEIIRQRTSGEVVDIVKEGKTNTESYTSETAAAVALAAHQLIAAPVPVTIDYEEDAQTTNEPYKYTTAYTITQQMPLSYEFNATEIRGPAKYSSGTNQESVTSFQDNATGQSISSARPTSYKIRTKGRRPTKFSGGYRNKVTNVESDADVISTLQPTTYESQTTDIRGETKYSTAEYRDSATRFESTADGISTIQPTMSTYEIKTRGPGNYWTGQYRSRTSSSLQTDEDSVSTVQPTTYEADTTDIRGSSRYSAEEYRGRVSEVRTNTDIPFVSTIQSYESDTSDTRGPLRYSTVNAYADGTYNENTDSDVISNRISTTYTPEIVNSRIPTRFTTANAYRGSTVQTDTEIPSTVSTITEYSFDSTLGKSASRTSQTGYGGKYSSEAEISESTSGRTDVRQPTRLITGSYSGRGTRPTIASESIDSLTVSGGSSEATQERGAGKYYVTSGITDIREPAQFSSSLDLRGSARFAGSETLTGRTIRPGFLPQNTIDPILSGITINIGAQKGDSTARYNSATDGSATTLPSSEYESRKSSQLVTSVSSGDELSTNIGESTATTASPSTVKSARPTGFTPSLLNLGDIAEEKSSLKYQINQKSNSYQSNERGPSTARYEENEKIPVPVIYAYSSSGSSSSQSSSAEPSYFTREYLLESPVTKTYEEEYQYLSPVTIPSTTGRKSIRRKIYRKYNAQKPVENVSTTTTTEAPSPSTEAPTPKRRTTTVKPFQKLTVRRVPLQSVQKITLSKKEIEEAKQKFKPAKDYDYYDDNHEKIAKYDGTKVIVRGEGNIQCLDIGNFPHPTSCKKFISCARIESGAVLGWEYICPKGLSFDPVGGICNWSAGLGCNEKDI